MLNVARFIRWTIQSRSTVALIMHRNLLNSLLGRKLRGIMKTGRMASTENKLAPDITSRRTVKLEARSRRKPNRNVDRESDESETGKVCESFEATPIDKGGVLMSQS